ncbi:MAG: hypothetical protein ACREIA_01365, partial [Opitutaceae bacterium]
AKAAQDRADSLQIDRAVYLRVLLHNDEIEPRALKGVRPVSVFERVKVSLDLPVRERARIRPRIAPRPLSEHLEQLVLEDTARPDAPLLIFPKPKP